MSKEDDVSVWMPLYISTWNDKTAHLSCEQDGAYGRLVRHYWKNGPLPDDDAQLARIVVMPLRNWRSCRIAIAPFFIIEGGLWRHDKVERVLAEQAEKRRRYVERAAAGGRAKAAKSTATSRTKALLGSCTLALDVEVEAPTGASTLYGQNDFSGPKEVRDAFVRAKGEAWVRSYIDPCGWQDVPERALIPASETAARKIAQEARSVMIELAITILKRRETA